jgi:hypothetical protein
MNLEDKKSTQNAPHFFWGNQCEGWWLKKEGLTVHAGQSHKVKNTFNKTTRFLVISCPNSHKDRIDED